MVFENRCFPVLLDGSSLSIGRVRIINDPDLLVFTGNSRYVRDDFIQTGIYYHLIHSCMKCLIHSKC